MTVATLVLIAASYSIDPSHTTAGFGVKHLMVSTTRGQFNKVAGTVEIDDADLTRSRIDVTIDAASVDTREPKRDEHLRSADFFDVAKYPTITFKSTRIEKGADGLVSRENVSGFVWPSVQTITPSALAHLRIAVSDGR